MFATIIIATAFLSAEEIKTSKSAVAFQANGKTYSVPIWQTVETVNVDTDGKITVFYTTSPNERDHQKLAGLMNQIKKFYTGKTIFGVKVGKFKKSQTGEHRQDLWVFEKCAADGKGLSVSLDGNYQMVGIDVSVSDTCPKNQS